MRRSAAGVRRSARQAARPRSAPRCSGRWRYPSPRRAARVLRWRCCRAPRLAGKRTAAEACHRGIERRDPEPQALIGAGDALPARVVEMKRDPQIVEAVSNGADGVRDAPGVAQPMESASVTSCTSTPASRAMARASATVSTTFAGETSPAKLQPKAAMTMILAIGTPASRCTRTYLRIASICPARSRLRFLIANGSDALSEMNPASGELLPERKRALQSRSR